ncbi:MAG TPA: hypothetical protein VNL94_07435 [Candidatus Binatia bacterium]|nr:hypothetical protein [Candidatus Binatia bacterium]
MSTDLAAVEARLRSIFDPYRARLTVAREGPDGIYLEWPGHEGSPWGYVGGTRLGKRYVSFYLMAASTGDLEGLISDALQKRRQGKSCFNFTTIDDPLLAELEALTARAIEAQPGLIERASSRHPARS